MTQEHHIGSFRIFLEQNGLHSAKYIVLTIRDDYTIWAVMMTEHHSGGWEVRFSVKNYQMIFPLVTIELFDYRDQAAEFACNSLAKHTPFFAALNGL